ncbi:MAG: DUF4625 domain-containing protein [Flavobacteriales bacterium]|nr:DUF4625 domain-containing protein [Flavobacteriales bacterium]
MNRSILYSTITILVFLFSCSKDDKDEIKPTITINSPVNLQQVNGIDTLQVLATISDDRNIESVSVSLRDNNDIPVLSSVTKTPNTKDYSLNISYFFDDIHLLTGQYDLSVTAFDGENRTTRYVTIFLNETPKNRQGAFVISNTGSVSDIYYLDNLYSGSFYQSINGDYMGAGVNSYDQQLIHASSGTVPSANVSAIDLKSGLNSWSIPIINSPPTPFYSGFLYDNENVFLGKRNGGMQGYDKNGAGNYNAVTISNFNVESALVHNNIIVTEQHSFSGGIVKLIPYWMASGNPIGINATLLSNEDVVGMFTRSANEIIVIANDAALNGKLIFYNPNTGSLTSFPIGLGKIDDCVEIGIGEYLVVHSGNISKINVNNNFPFSTTIVISGLGANNIWYDDLLAELFISSGNVLTIHNVIGTQIGSYTHINTIKEVVFWYNK